MKLEQKNTKAICAITTFLWLLLLNFSALAQTSSLEGSWTMYNDKGEKYDKPAKVAQSGVGNATVKNGIFSATLPANFPASPAPCFKIWENTLWPSRRNLKPIKGYPLLV